MELMDATMGKGKLIDEILSFIFNRLLTDYPKVSPLHEKRHTNFVTVGLTGYNTCSPS
jgi:hypothetical protein